MKKGFFYFFLLSIAFSIGFSDFSLPIRAFSIMVVIIFYYLGTNVYEKLQEITDLLKELMKEK